MASWTVIKSNPETGEILFLMANALGTKTFKNDLSNAWTSHDHREASDMMTVCINKHKDYDEWQYIIDDLDESPEW